MKKILIILSAILFIGNVSSGQVSFEKTYGSLALDEEGKSVQQTFDGGYIIGGTNLIKTSDSGIVEWIKPYPSNYTNTTSDSGYILIHNNSDIYFTKVDKIGDTVWSTSYGAGLWAREGYSIEETDDGGYIVAGRFQDFSGSGMMLLKLNSSGIVSWRKTYSEATSAAFCYGLDAHQTTDGGYIIAGYTYVNYYDTNRHKDIFVAKTDSVGTTQWLKNIGGANEEVARGIQEAHDGGFVIAGSLHDSSSASTFMYYLKIDALGDTVWTQQVEIDPNGVTPGKKSVFNSIAKADNNGFILVGESNEFITAAIPWSRVMSYRIDSMGKQLWRNHYGYHSGGHRGYSVMQTADKGFIIAGKVVSNATSNENVYLLKIDSLGYWRFPVSVDGVEIEKDIEVYPNPTNSVIFIDIKNKQSNFYFYSLSGRLILSGKLIQGKNQINLKELNVGIYLYEIRQGDTILKSGKILKQ